MVEYWLRNKIPGFLCALLANIYLGGSSIYWRQLAAISSVSLVIYRVFLSLAILVMVFFLVKRCRESCLEIDLRLVLIHAFASILLAINWGVFIGASVSGKVIESGIGYLLAPIVALGVGVVFFKESLSVLKWVIIISVTFGLGWLIFFNADMDFRVCLTIGLAWGGYTCLKKISTLTVFLGLVLETLFLALFCILYLALSDSSMALPDDLGVYERLLILSCGMISLIPLALFSFAAKEVGWASMGLIQFLLPITQFLVAVFVYEKKASFGTCMVFLVILVAVMLLAVEPFVPRRLLNRRGE